MGGETGFWTKKFLVSRLLPLIKINKKTRQKNSILENGTPKNPTRRVKFSNEGESANATRSTKGWSKSWIKGTKSPFIPRNLHTHWQSTKSFPKKKKMRSRTNNTTSKYSCFPETCAFFLLQFIMNLLFLLSHYSPICWKILRQRSAKFIKNFYRH